MIRNARLMLAAIALAAPFAHAQPADDAARALAATCANCHGTGGRSQGVVPSLAGMPKPELMQKMNEFRDGTRTATIMHQIAKGYTPQQVDSVATWFAAQKR